MELVSGIACIEPVDAGAAQVLTPAALAFVADLHRRFNPTRVELLQRRQERQAEFDAGVLPDFRPETAAIRRGDWQVAPAPPDLQDRRVEMTGPVDRKMLINGLNSGARVFMADFEDATSPTWANVVAGQGNLIAAIRGTIEHRQANGRVYRLGERVATLKVRPRGWHLDERHLQVDGGPVSASLCDFGLFAFHNARRLLEQGSGPYFYLPKLESHREARLWNDVFLYTEEALGLPCGCIKATVLIETIAAAFEMEEILYELREHVAGLNAGRWDYIFSLIKKFRLRPDFVLPDRSQVTMAVPFMRAYTELLVKTCHRRGAHAIGGMAAFIPDRRDPAVNAAALARVQEDKQQEATAGFDGTWVAHPDLVPVAEPVFTAMLGSAPHQVHRQRDDVQVTAADLLDVRSVGSEITSAGLRANIAVGVQYLEAWLRGTGAVGLYNLMEDAATAEICRSQVWQWVRHGACTSDGEPITRERVTALTEQALAELRTELGAEACARRRFADARELFEQVALGEPFCEFLTLPAYALID